MKKEITTVLAVLTFILVFVTFMLQESRLNEIKYTERQRSVEMVCKEWQHTYPQNKDLYSDCTIRNVRKLERSDTT